VQTCGYTASSGLASFERTDRDGERTLVVEGEVDLAEREEFGRQLSRLLAETHSPGFVDLSGVTFMDSSGISEIVEAQRRADHDGVELVLLAPSPPVRRVLDVTGVSGLVPVRDR